MGSQPAVHEGVGAAGVQASGSACCCTSMHTQAYTLAPGACTHANPQANLTCMSSAEAGTGSRQGALCAFSVGGSGGASMHVRETRDTRLP